MIDDETRLISFVLNGDVDKGVCLFGFVLSGDDADKVVMELLNKGFKMGLIILFSVSCIGDCGWWVICVLVLGAG